MNAQDIENHPVQTHQNRHGAARCPKAVTLAAYEVYCHIYGSQEALVTGGCRGGFSTGELIAFLLRKIVSEERMGSQSARGISGDGTSLDQIVPL
jgi:hypothetical protein